MFMSFHFYFLVFGRGQAGGLFEAECLLNFQPHILVSFFTSTKQRRKKKSLTSYQGFMIFQCGHLHCIKGQTLINI